MRIRLVGEIALGLAVVGLGCLWYSATIRCRKAWSCGYAQAKANFVPPEHREAFDREVKAACDNDRR